MARDSGAAACRGGSGRAEKRLHGLGGVKTVSIDLSMYDAGDE